VRASLFILVLLLSCGTSAQDKDAIIGVWLSENEDAYIKIYEKEGSFWGRVTWLEEPYDENGEPVTDPEGNPIDGMDIMKNFVYDDGQWVDGTIYDAEQGKTYYGSLEPVGRDKLKFRGSLDSGGVIGHTETWTRMQRR
jgi:uncharacterized protein (DUF2147 family)